MLLRLLLLLMLCNAAQAHTPVELDPAAGVIALSGHMSWLQSDTTLSATEAAAATWQPLAGDPSFGFTRKVSWLRFAVTQPATSSAQWRLEVNNALLEDVRLYLRTGNGPWQEQRAGRVVPHDAWPLDSRSPVFRLDLPAGDYQAMLRLETRNSMSTTVQLWEAEHYNAAARSEAMTWGSYFGLYGMVILFQILFWHWTREALSGWYAPYAGLNCLGILMTLGYPQTLFGWPASFATPLLGVVLCVTLGVGTKFSAVMLDLQHAMPRLNRWAVRSAALISAVTGLLVLTGQYGLGVGIGQVITILWMLGMFGVAIMLLQRGHPQARFFLAAFSIFFLGVLIRYLRNLGFLDAGFLTDNSVQIGSLLHMVAMCMFIVYRYNALKISLRIEQAARQEQRDFVAMVSHEYRTPLAIITTSVQQLAANLDAPQEKTLKRCANIRQAAERMNDLLDEYLSVERHEETHQTAQIRLCDPQELLAGVVAQWPAERVRLHLQPLPARLACDRALLEVALNNLLTNADRHAPADSIIEISAHCASSGVLNIIVADQGPGIPADELAQVFDKYFRGRAARGKPGAGLGLFLVKRIIEKHRGRITVTSTPQGTRFEISLPVTTLEILRGPRR